MTAKRYHQWGRGGLPAEIVQRVEALKAAGHGPWAAARRAGVDYRSARKIFDGVHPRQRDRAARCPGCGALCKTPPCLACNLRSSTQARAA